VIISIIGGEDMKLLEVDEAANHIRELVDNDANIIWGSAFNPGLNGKIRVSVVATGIEQTTEQAEVASRPLNLARSRGPVLPGVSRPVAGFGIDPAPAAAPIPAEAPDAALPEPESDLSAPTPGYDTADDGAPLDLDTAQTISTEPSQGVGETEEEPEAAVGRESAYASLTGLGRPRDEPLDLGLEQVDTEEPDSDAPPSGRQDELLLDADRLASEDAPVGSQAGRLGNEAAGIPTSLAGATAEPTPERPAPASGTTLFERMANLSRTKASGDGDDDDSGSSISIPRFLGRQNNQ
jgi:cell division protein FtsZ